MWAAAATDALSQNSSGCKDHTATPAKAATADTALPHACKGQAAQPLIPVHHPTARHPRPQTRTPAAASPVSSAAPALLFPLSAPPAASPAAKMQSPFAVAVDSDGPPKRGPAPTQSPALARADHQPRRLRPQKRLPQPHHRPRRHAAHPLPRAPLPHRLALRHADRGCCRPRAAACRRR